MTLERSVLVVQRLDVTVRVISPPVEQGDNVLLPFATVVLQIVFRLVLRLGILPVVIEISQTEKRVMTAIALTVMAVAQNVCKKALRRVLRVSVEMARSHRVRVVK